MQFHRKYVYKALFSYISSDGLDWSSTSSVVLDVSSLLLHGKVCLNINPHFIAHLFCAVVALLQAITMTRIVTATAIVKLKPATPPIIARV